MNPKTYWKLELSATIGILLFFVTAVEGAGKFILTPKFVAGLQTESNYFKSETDEQAVLTYLIQPGIDFGYETAKSFISLDYTLNAFFYDAREPAAPGQPRAVDDDYLGHTAIFRSLFRPTDRLRFQLDNSFWLTRNPAQTDALDNRTDRDRYWINRFTPGLYYEFYRRFGASIQYRNTKIHWLEGTNDDSVENRGLFSLIYNLSRTAHLDLEYQHWRKQYDGSTSDYDSNQVRLIVRKQFKYISFVAGGGYQDRRFDDPSLDDISTPTFMGAIVGQFPPAPDPPSSHFTLMFDQNFNDQGQGNQYYVARRLTLKAGHTFLGKITGEFDGWFQNSDYKDTIGITPSGEIETRNDDRIYLFASIGYRFLEWITFSVGGGYEERDSNIDGLDFDNTLFKAWAGFKRKF